MTGAHIRRLRTATMLPGLVAALAVWLVPAPARSQAAEGAAPYETVAVVQPADQQTVFSNDGAVTVTVAVSPDLHAGDQVVLLLDGAVVARQASGRFQLSGLDRGGHSLQARIVSGGRTVLASAPVGFYLWHASRLFPNARR